MAPRDYDDGDSDVFSDDEFDDSDWSDNEEYGDDEFDDGDPYEETDGDFDD